MNDDRAFLLARIEALKKENAALLLLLENHGIAYERTATNKEEPLLPNKKPHGDLQH